VTCHAGGTMGFSGYPVVQVGVPLNSLLCAEIFVFCEPCGSDVWHQCRL
jgi:hypothetical protein